MSPARTRPGEFELIARYFRPLAATPGALALTDDAAVFAPKAGEEVVVTCDAIAAGVHFFPDDPPESIASKAIRVNLSDLAAKGATPFGYMMALALPADWTEAWVRRFAAALAEDGQRYGVSLLGGDTIRASGGVTVSITALGAVPKGKMVLRSGAKPGDAVLVSGTIGDAALGLRVRNGTVPKPPGSTTLVNRYLRPEPRVELAPIVRRFATSAIDVSDGLLGDLGHICDTSGVGAAIDAEAVPLSAAARRVLGADPSVLGIILNGGDDYEILATVSATHVAGFIRDAATAGVPVARIGKVTAGKGPPVVNGRDGRPIAISGHSHSHF